MQVLKDIIYGILSRRIVKNMDVKHIENRNIVVYSLTGRGLYSELINLVLASVYCEKNSLELVVNTYNWNAKYKLGWNDYFSSSLKVSDSIFSSQIHFQGFKYQITIKSFVKNPIREIKHVILCLLNIVFKLKTGNFLTHDIVSCMRDQEFVLSLGTLEKWKAIFINKINEIYILNTQLKNELDACICELGLKNLDYIGMHIRRGDKIKSKEMDHFSLDSYVREIVNCKHKTRNVYIATDDISIIDSFKRKLGSEYNVLYNKGAKSKGFNEAKFNKKSRKTRFWDMKMTLLDVEILSASSFFIGTYSSNLSRIVPCLRNFENCRSMDIEWYPVF